MSRETNINVNVNSGKSIATISKLKEAFEGLKVAKDSVSPDGKINLAIDFKGADGANLDAMSKAIARLGTGMKNVAQNSKVVAEAGGVFNVTTNSITNNTIKASKAVDGLGNSIDNTGKQTVGGILALESLRRATTQFIDTYSQLTGATFDVGIASQMNIQQIGELNKSFIDLSTTVPSSAKEMAQATDALIRTGRGFEESKKIIEQVAILSTASGDALKDTAGVVTKVMVSLNIGADRTKETLNTMHSTAIQTASDMSYLAEAYKNVASSASVMVKQSGLSGKELEDYKQKMLDFSMASIGSMANLGIGASSAGTKLKTLFTKLVATEKSAKKLFDTEMAIKNIRFEDAFGTLGKTGDIFNFDKMATLAKKDLPKAVQLMSELFIQGKLSTQTMQKMFTARHFQDISDLLLVINGNMDEFTTRIAKGVNYADDFYKKMFDINKQWDLLKNNAIATTSGSGQYMTEAMTGVLMKLNELLPKINTAGKETIGMVLGLGSTFGTASLAIGTFIKYIIPLAKAGGTIGVIAGAVAVGVGLIGKSIYDANKKIADLNLNMGQAILYSHKLENQLKANMAIRENLARVIDEEKNYKGIAPQIEEASTMMGLLLDKFKETKDRLHAIDEYKMIDTIEIPDINTKSFDKLSSQAKEKTAEVKSIVQNGLRGITGLLEESQKQIYRDFDSESFGGREGLSRSLSLISSDINKYKLLFAEFERLTVEGVDVDEKMKLMDEYSSSIGANAEMLDKMFGAIDSDKIRDVAKEQEKLNKLMEEDSEAILKIQKEIFEQTTKNSQAFNMLVAHANQMKLIAFEKTGSYKGNKGWEGIYTMYSESSMEQSKRDLDLLDKQKEELEKQVDFYSKKIKPPEKPTGYMATVAQPKIASEEAKYITDIEVKLKGIEDRRLSILEIQKKGVGVSKEEASLLFDGIILNSATLPLMIDLLQNQDRLNKARAEGNLIIAEGLESDISAIRVVTKLYTEEALSKQRQTDYQIKYNNYLKDSLDLELELNKVMMSQEKQQSLIYEYKAKQIQADLDINKREVDATRGALYKLKAKDYANILNAKEGQKVIDEFYAQYKGELVGKDNKALKDRYEALKQYVSALSKQEQLEMKLDLVPLQEMDAILKSIPDTLESAYMSLQKFGEFSGDYSYGDKIQKELKRNIESQIKTFNTSFKPLDNLTSDNIKSRLEKAQLAVLESEEKVRQMWENRGNTSENIKPLSDKEKEMVATLSEEEKQLKNILRIMGLINKEKDVELEKTLKILDVYNKIGGTMSSLGSAMGSQGLQDFGDMFTGFGDMQKTMAKNPNANFGDMFTDFGSQEWADNASKNLENAMSGIKFGSMVGTQIANSIGGGQSAKSGGAIGGMIAGAGGAKSLAGLFGMAGSTMATAGASLAISAGASLIGGLFDKGGNEQAKADRKTAEAKKAYDKNTDALNELSRNMANLNAGIDGLNSSLISSFSSLSTFGNLTDVTSTLEEMYTLMYSTRNFDSVAYQVTKTKKGKRGFMGIGSTQGSTWTETYEKDIQEMLNIYGYKGTIYDMTTQEMRDFSKWLDEYDMGDSDNFSVMADALEEYAEALEKFDKNIDKFFYDATMEGFVGISSIQQEALRQQIEDFYKNLGIVIDEEISAEIDKLAEQMSVMVTIMADVRGDFIDIWMNTGEEAGSAFVKSMSSYMEALMNNMSQVFFDIYLSDVTKGLSDEFKTMSEELVELKKQGSELKWEDVTDSLSDNFAKVLEYIASAKEQTASFNDVILELQKQALEAGFTISELIDMGIATGTQKTVVDSFEQALLSDEEAFISIGKMVGDMVGEAMAKSMIDNLMSEQVLAFSNQLDEVINGSMSFDSLTDLAGEAMSIGMMMEAERKRLEAITDMFNLGDVTYENQETKVDYSSGVSQSVIQNYFLSSSVSAGTVVESDSIEALADELLDQIIEKLKVDKGIDITKNY